MDYSAVVESLYERHRSVRDAGFSGSAYKPGLDAMLSYAEFLGHPERQFRSIHVAGTNGKGSVCSMLAAALAARGLSVGLYTSPHLVDFRERIKIIEVGPGAPLPQRELRLAHPSVPLGPTIPLHPQGTGGVPPDTPCLDNLGWAPPSNVSEGGHGSSEAGGLPASSMIPEAAVCDFLERYDREGLTFFEVTTGMAFWWFAEQKVDVAVIETGLGGRLDSTNIITPEISVITSIGLDHCDLLGSTRAEIAAEKAGIFKPGVPAVVWGRDPETQPVFERTAVAVGAPLHFAEDFPLPDAAESLTLDLSGPCQDLNLRTVLAALQLLPAPGAQLDDNEPNEQSACTQNDACKISKWLMERELRSIAKAAAITGLRGRWEQLLNDPLTICDIGHNPPAMEANCRKLEQLRSATGKGIQLRPSSLRCGRVTQHSFPRSPLLFVYGAMKDKDVDDIKHYLPTDATYYLVQPQTPRAMPLEELALKLKNLRTIAAGSVQQGVKLALERAKQEPGTIVYIGGSTFVVSEAIIYIESL